LNFEHGVADLAKRKERSGRNDFANFMEWWVPSPELFVLLSTLPELSCLS